MGDYKDSIKEINKLYTDRKKRAAARSFMLSCKESGIAYNVALDLLKSSAAVPASDQIADKTTLKPSETDFKPVTTEQVENTTLSCEIVQNEPLNDNIEVVTDSGGLNMAEIENKIYVALDDFLNSINCEDMTKATQRQFMAFSMYVGKHVFKGTDILKDKSLYNNNSAFPTTSNRYDMQKIIAVLNLYIFLCTKYNKAFTIDGGEYFCGVSDGFITKNVEKLTSLGFSPHKKAENTIAAGLLDGRINPTGSIAWLNYNAKWSQPAQTAAKPQNNIYIFPSLGKLSPGVVPELPKVTE